MIDFSRQPTFEDTSFWQAIPSTVTDDDLDALQGFVCTPLPGSYRTFLKHRHFVELVLGEYSISFFPSLLDKWLDTMKRKIEEYRDVFTHQGLIPIADFSDYGVVCFDSRSASDNEHEYPVVWLDHEDGYDQKHPLAENFMHLFQQFELHLDEWISNVREGESS